MANGKIYPLPAGLLKLGEHLTGEMLPALEENKALAELRAAVARDEMIVGVSDDVAQQLALGQRELERRSRRRRRARRS